jgi:hypothetical protein
VACHDRTHQSLDLLRGVAILLVLHCAQATTSIIPGLNWFVLEYGELGVQRFSSSVVTP